MFAEIIAANAASDAAIVADAMCRYPPRNPYSRTRLSLKARRLPQIMCRKSI